MEKVVVLGATGGMGSALVKELVGQGFETVAFARTKSKLAALRNKCGDRKYLMSYYAGDVFNLEDLVNATRGADLIIHSVNIPYPEWEAKLLTLANHVVQAAKMNRSKLVVVDNVYPYGRPQMDRVTENHPKEPHTKKGKLRLEMERLIFAAHQTGLPALIARLPDFYGPEARNTLLDVTFQAIVKGKSGIFIGSQDLPREFIYTPDGAKAVAELSKHADAYGQNWNIPGPGTITGREIIQIAKDAAGTNKPVRSIGKNMMAFVGLFNPIVREAVEMMYLNEQPLVLSGEKYERQIGPVPKTPYAEGIRMTIRSLQEANR
ncbi:SDR family NAD(P)-dependent oxidoreductase [Effusibacillus dendaii]|uniref:Epimerase n=1 Tax=Effusibacillus dendaii TaxID=2743772 RepID=A0A7I8DIB2_9BACL|nr:SDR family NAD(P)-dependent oxidoreductase [Effusibacillus dendaii]BCJ87581.1 epimerase [Effusibacillus dendaii]